MFKPFSVFVGLRYTRSRRRNQFISFVSLFSLFGMVLGVASLIVVMSVMNGFEAELRSRILSFLPHVLIEPRDEALSDWQQLAAVLEQEPGVEAAAPYIEGTGLVSQSSQVRGVHINGVDPLAQMRISVVGRYMRAGEMTQLQSGQFGIVVGSILARQVGVSIGDKLTVMLPKVTVTPAGLFPRVKRFTVVGIFEVGAQLDGQEVFIHMDDAARLFGLREGVHGLQLKTTDVVTAPEVASRLARRFEKFEVRDWGALQGNLFQAVKMEKLMVGLMLFIIVGVAAFNIVSILTMMVADKRADIAVLRTMGALPGHILRIFIVQGATIGFSGTVLGALIGLPLAYNLGAVVGWLEHSLRFSIFDPNVYFITRLPSEVHLNDVAWTLAGALLLSFTATLYPAWRATRIEPVEVLRYE
ncbi:MAG: lipoprotein-releasing ABC transporter permease subunit [Pseudomonadales bacterium]